jgi:hypothetical protein
MYRRRVSLILVGSLLTTVVMTMVTTSAQAKTLVGVNCSKVGVKVGDGPGRTVVCKKIGKKTVWQLLIMSSTQVQQVPSKRTPSTTPTPTPTEVAGVLTKKVGAPCYENGKIWSDDAGKVLYCKWSGNSLVWAYEQPEQSGAGGGSQGAKAPSAGKNANPNLGLHWFELFSQSRIYSKHGKPKFTYSPMDVNSIGSITPIGFTGSRLAPADSIFDPTFDPAIGATFSHTLPSDHGGVGFKNFEDHVNFHPTFAVADGTIAAVIYQQGWGDPHPGTTQRLDSYSFVFQYSKNFFLMINHLTQLEPTLLKQIGSLEGLPEKITDIPVKAGQLLGMTGGTTNIGGFDFVVYDMDSKALSCTLSPTTDRNAHSVDPYQFFVEPLRSQLYAKLPPRPEPRAGQWCYNIAGKLVGNWFFYYHGTVKTDEPGLGFFYDVNDPSIILIGDAQTGRVYTVNGNAPDPATIDVNSGLIKYALTDDDPRNSGVTGVMLVQMTDKAKIKMEFFPNASADQVTGFTSGAQQLYR